MSKATCEKLAKDFESVGDWQSAKQAREGMWDDFKSPLIAPQTALYTLARNNAYHHIAQGVLEGRYDG